MPSNESWRNCNGRGLYAEERVAKQLREANWFVTVPSNEKDLFKDMSVWRVGGAGHGLAFRVEVKNEDAKVDTGNLCVEMMQADRANPDRRVPSGLSVTEATVVVHTLGENVAMYRSGHMRRFIKNELSMPGESASVRKLAFGDNGNTGVLVKLSELKKHVGDWFDYRSITSISESPLWDK